MLHLLYSANVEPVPGQSSYFKNVLIDCVIKYVELFYNSFHFICTLLIYFLCVCVCAHNSTLLKTDKYIT